MSTKVRAQTAQILSRLRVGSEGSFGSIRFENGSQRAAPSKFIKVQPNTSGSDLIELMLETWKIPPPCAVLSLAHCATPEAFNKMDQNLLSRGIAEATQKSKAWVVTSGDAQCIGADLGGSANLYGARELEGHYGRPWTSPCIGIAPWQALRDREALEQLPLGAIHRMEDPALVAAHRDRDASFSQVHSLT